MTRLASLEDEVKLQVAPLKALQLELAQSRLDTETARKRLMDDRRESRIRYAASTCLVRGFPHI